MSVDNGLLHGLGVAFRTNNTILNTEHKGKWKAIVVHQTDSSSAASTLVAYETGGTRGNGALISCLIKTARFIKQRY